MTGDQLGAARVIAFGLCALSGAVVGLVVGLLVGIAI